MGKRKREKTKVVIKKPVTGREDTREGERTAQGREKGSNAGNASKKETFFKLLHTHTHQTQKKSDFQRRQKKNTILFI